MFFSCYVADEYFDYGYIQRYDFLETYQKDHNLTYRARMCKICSQCISFASLLSVFQCLRLIKA